MKNSTTGVTGIGLNTMDTTFTRKQRLLLTAPNCDAGGQCAKQGHYRPWSSRNFCSDCTPGCARSHRCESLSAANRGQVTGSAWPRGFSRSDEAQSHSRSEEHTSELQSHSDLVC